MAENMPMSPADFGALMNRGGSFGSGDGLIWVVLLIVLLGGGNAFGGGRNQMEFLQSQMQQGFDNQNTMANQRETLAAVNAGTSETVAAVNQAKYDNINVAKDIQMALAAELNRLESAGASILANQNQCCCNTLRAIDSVNFNAAQNTAAINATTTAAIQKVLDAITENKLDSMRGRINQLELDRAVSGVVRYPTTFAYNAGQSPFCGGCNGCGCGCGSF